MAVATLQASAVSARAGADSPSPHVDPLPPVPPDDPGPWVDPAPVADPEPPAPLAASVRPYILTGGRTHSRTDLGLETLVSTRPYLAALAPPSSREHRNVVALCERPQSLAEVAALLRVPLGVARVLIGDLVELGALAVHHGTEPRDTPPNGILLRRVLEGLRRL